MNLHKELDAQQLAVYDSLRNEVPFPLVEFAKKIGIKDVRETYEFEDGHSGSIVREPEGYIIYVNANHSQNRKRFTIAHEIGHFIFDKESLEHGTEHLDTTHQPALHRSTQHDPSTDNMEIRANKFAAELLMPKEEFEEAIKKYSSIEPVADIFKVSTSAAAIRANNLGYFFI